MSLWDYYRFLEAGRELVGNGNKLKVIGATSPEVLGLQTALININDILAKIAERYLSDCRCTNPAPNTEKLQQARKCMEALGTSSRMLRLDRHSFQSSTREKDRPDTAMRIANIVEEHLRDVKRLTAMGFSWEPLLPHAQSAGREASSHAATAFLALVRLCIVPKQQCVVLHVVGAEKVEGETAEETVRQWDLLVRLLALGGATKLVLVFIGPQIPGELHSQVWHGGHTTNNGRKLDLELRWSQVFYHDWWEQRSVHLDVVSYPMPDLVLLPNAGLWVFEEWDATLRLVYSRIRRPLVVTARSFIEAIKDEAALCALGINSWLWRPELSPYPADPWTFQPDLHLSGENPDDRTKLVKANANTAWQCILAQAQDPCPLEGAPSRHLLILGLLRPPRK
mmetsp:Transcript_149185/g.285911  ORF Transcript_149185/g.285911 Transcript_149185/m.285911 type:complete len:396 (-) Transcript_149185:69-1256(-)